MREKNFIRLNSWSPLTVPYAYIDHESYLADQIFIQKKMTIRFKGEMVKEDFPYRIIFCRVWKKDVVRFEEALSKLTDKMLLFGYSDYPEFCRQFMELTEKAIERSWDF